MGCRLSSLRQFHGVLRGDARVPWERGQPCILLLRTTSQAPALALGVRGPGDGLDQRFPSVANIRNLLGDVGKIRLLGAWDP